MDWLVAVRALASGTAVAMATSDSQQQIFWLGSISQVSSSMGSGVGVGTAVEWLAEAGALRSGTAASRAAAVERGSGAVEWSAAARGAASGTAAAGGSEDRGVRMAAARLAELGL